MKNLIPRQLTIVALLIFSTAFARAGDTDLLSALDAANAGRSQEAISILESLRSTTPSDARVLQRLGLLYQSTGRYREAISTLERATSIQRSPEALYALGLLYEAQLLAVSDSSEKGTLRSNAIGSWKGLMTLVPPEDPRHHTAQRHIQNLSEAF